MFRIVSFAYSNTAYVPQSTYVSHSVSVIALGSREGRKDEDSRRELSFAF
jgi:hypothetical protein